MLHDQSTPGLRDLSAENRLKIDAELHELGDPDRTPSARVDEDATGTRLNGPFMRFDEDAAGTRMSGPFGRFDEDATGTRLSGPMFRELGSENAAKIADELRAANADDAASTRFDEDATGTRMVGPIGARFDEDATGTRVSGPMFG